MRRVAGFCICFQNDVEGGAKPTLYSLQTVAPAAKPPSSTSTTPTESPAPADPDEFAKGAYSAMETPELVKPVPIKTPPPLYTAEAMRQKIQGIVGVEFVVGIDGTVEDARVVQSLDSVYGLDESALRATRQATFKPATLNGTKVRARVSVFVYFNLH